MNLAIQPIPRALGINGNSPVLVTPCNFRRIRQPAWIKQVTLVPCFPKQTELLVIF